MIEPTIGRQVWFFRAGPKLMIDPPEAATVCYVHNERLVNLRVIDHGGNARSETSVQLRQPEDLPCPVPYCEWMPYQKGQAAKTEQLESAAKA